MRSFVYCKVCYHCIEIKKIFCTFSPQFLETESKPKPIPELPTIPPTPPPPRMMTPTNGPASSSTPLPSPAVNNPIFGSPGGVLEPPGHMMPSFAHNRSSSAILKNVLQSDDSNRTPGIKQGSSPSPVSSSSTPAGATSLPPSSGAAGVVKDTSAATGI